MNQKKVWKKILSELEVQISPAHFKLYFSSLTLSAISQTPIGYTCTLTAPNQYIKEHLVNNYQAALLGAFKSALNANCTIVWNISRAVTGVDFGPLFEDKKQGDNKLEDAIRKAHLRKFFTFDSFAVSSSNEMAYAAAKAVAKNPGKAYNPLFFYGGVGVGKTHLMQAIAKKVLEKNSALSVLYCTGEEFTNEIIEAIQGKKTITFRKKYRKVNLLIIDDIQFIAGKNTVQEEFFHTFNSLHQEGGQVILGSDKPPSEIQKLEERLASRFEAGLIVDIQEPNFELRTAILLIKAKMHEIILPMDVAQLLAAKIKSTRQLEGAIIKLKAFAQTQGKPITPELAVSLLSLSASENNKINNANPRELISQVAHFFDLKVSQLKGKERHKHIVLPRQIAMFLLREDGGFALIEVGKMFGGRDHTTVMHSVDKIKKLLVSSEEIRLSVSSLRKSIF